MVGENGRNPEKKYPDPVSSTTKSTWNDRHANSGPQQWEASDKPLAPRGRPGEEKYQKINKQTNKEERKKKERKFNFNIELTQQNRS